MAQTRFVVIHSCGAEYPRQNQLLSFIVYFLHYRLYFEISRKENVAQWLLEALQVLRIKHTLRWWDTLTKNALVSWRSVIVLSVCYISTSDSSSPRKFKLQFSPCFWFGVIVFLTARAWFTVLFLMCCSVGSTGQGQRSHAPRGKRWMMCLYITWQSLCWLDIFRWATFNPIFHCIYLWGHGSSALCNRDIALDGKGHVDEVITQLQSAEEGFQWQTLSRGGWELRCRFTKRHSWPV